MLLLTIFILTDGVEAGCGYDRLRPARDDWNEDLQAALRRRL